jgi:hypothetical protein
VLDLGAECDLDRVLGAAVALVYYDVITSNHGTMAQERRKGGRRRSDRRSRDKSVTLTNERSTGGVEHDERGDARWVWASEQQARDASETFDELKALDNDTLEILELADPVGKKPPGGGYNPYDVTTPKKRTAKNRR